MTVHVAVQTSISEQMLRLSHLWTSHLLRAISGCNATCCRTYPMKLLAQFFTWWNGSTWGTRFYTWRFGKRVGEDQFGNVYYEGDGGRRWVQYNGPAEPSMIPPGWHGWMHKRTNTPPSEENYVARDWEKQHKPNMTGTSQAYFPKGSLSSQEKRPKVTGDYEAWRP
jgi:NADH:ubiquinone oxidoreductase subunit